MAATLKPPRTRSNAAPAPKTTGLISEAWWLVSVAIAVYLVLILYTYDRADPAWSHSGRASEIHNAGGAFGAWLADILLYLFGASAYWWIALALFGVGWGYQRMERRERNRRSAPVMLLGFALMIVASSAIEALRLYSHSMSLPLVPGGMIGKSLAPVAFSAFGFTGATLFLIVLFAVGLSLFTGRSWLTLLEIVGGALERSYVFIGSRIGDWRDARAGKQASLQRETAVKTEKKRIEEKPPLKITLPEVEIKKSERTVREKQTRLFADLPDSALPPLDLLDQVETETELLSAETLEFTSRLIERKLLDFGVEVKVLAAYPGPVITRYEFEPAVGVKGSQITNLVRDLARSLSVASIRVVETIPGKTSMGLEIPNPQRQTVYLSEIISSEAYAELATPLTIAMGKDIAGKPVVADLAKMPHALVAGTTGSGKSVAINAMILSLVYKADPSQVRLILVDPKMLELSVYEGIPHLLAPVVTDMKKAAHALNWGVAEMERRYKLMAALGVRNITGYNQKLRDAVKAGKPITHPFSLTPDQPEPLDELPFIVIVIDELADLMMVVGKKVEELIARLAQKARASGIHLVLATQRPSVDVITGLIKANIPSRIAFQVSSKIDSRTILDQMGAEALLGQGDMLYLPPGSGYPQRIHGAFVSDHEVHRVVDHLRSLGAPQYIDEISAEDSMVDGEDGDSRADAEADALYDEAVAIVMKTRRASISLVQRHLRIGYNRAARLIEAMEAAGLVSAMQSNGNREVLAKDGGE